MEWMNLVPSIAVGCACLLAGYALGARRGRRLKRQSLRDMNAQSLALLDAKASLNSLEHYASQQQRKDKLLKLTLRKLQQANARCLELNELLTTRKKQHFSETSRLRLQAVEAREVAAHAAIKATARATARATSLARQTKAHLQRLEQASPVTQTIEAPAPKSYGTGNPVTVSVVDQARLDTPSDAPTPVSNRDSARLTKLRSSNEAGAAGL